MNIVEFALKFKDMASSELRMFGSSSQYIFQQAQGYTGQLIAKNDVLGQSYEQIQSRMRDVEKIIRNSTIKSEIKAARAELEALQKRAEKHPGSVGGGSSSGGSSGGGFSIGNLVKGNVIAGAAMKLGGAAIDMVKNFVGDSEEIYKAQAVAETRLAAVMKNTMGAAGDEVKAITELAAAQQKLGVVSGSVQLTGAQELSTYLTKTESLKSLLPVMNDMLAQQYGLNATQEQAQNIATMLGKVMDGQVGALSRYGYKFDEAQENILKYGTEAQRAATLIDVVGASVGGVNEALAKTPEGILKQNQMAMEDLKGRTGKTVVDMKVAFAPLGTVAIDLVSKLMPVIEGLVKPVADGVQRLIGWVKSLKSETGGFVDYWNRYKNLFVDHILPMIQNLWDFISDIVVKVVEFVSTSELLKDIFSFIGWLMGGIYDALSIVIQKLKSLFDNIVMPIWEAVEAVYRLIKGVPQKSALSVKTTEEKRTTQENTDLMKSIAKSSAETSKGVYAKEKATTSGGPKVINITVQKFMETLTIATNSLRESDREIEDRFNELFARVLLQGAVAE